MKLFPFPLILVHEIQFSHIDILKKDLCINYMMKKFMEPQSQRGDLKRINLLFNMKQPLEFKHVLVLFGKGKKKNQFHI
jgi:hypothetical protein